MDNIVFAHDARTCDAKVACSQNDSTGAAQI